MSKVNLFLDSSALFAGVVSPNGAARVLLLLAETEEIYMTVSEQVIVETERAIARKLPHLIDDFRSAVFFSRARIVPSPSGEEVETKLSLISHPPDVPILVAAMKARVDYLVTLNRKHFIENPAVARRSGLRIGTPGDALEWVRKQLEG